MLLLVVRLPEALAWVVLVWVEVLCQRANRMKAEGLESDLMARIAADPAFPLDGEGLTALLAPEKYTGRAEEQTERFLTRVVDPILEAYQTVDMGTINV